MTEHVDTPPADTPPDTTLQRVSAYVEAAKDQPTVWGESDCTGWPRRWVEQFHGRKMRLPIWRSREDAAAFIAKAGSLEKLWSDAIDEFVPPTGEKLDALVVEEPKCNWRAPKGSQMNLMEKRPLVRDPIPDHARVFDAIATQDGNGARAAMTELLELALFDTTTAPKVAGSSNLDGAAA